MSSSVTAISSMILRNFSLVVTSVASPRLLPLEPSLVELEKDPARNLAGVSGIAGIGLLENERKDLRRLIFEAVGPAPVVRVISDARRRLGVAPMISLGVGDTNDCRRLLRSIASPVMILALSNASLMEAFILDADNNIVKCADVNSIRQV